MKAQRGMKGVGQFGKFTAFMTKYLGFCEEFGEGEWKKAENGRKMRLNRIDLEGWCSCESK